MVNADVRERPLLTPVCVPTSLPSTYKCAVPIVPFKRAGTCGGGVVRSTVTATKLHLPGTIAPASVIGTRGPPLSGFISVNFPSIVLKVLKLR